MDQIAVEDRARWLAELADAIGSALDLTWRMAAERGLSSDTLDLLARLEFARVEVETLRCTAWSRRLREFQPNRSERSVGAWLDDDR